MIQPVIQRGATILRTPTKPVTDFSDPSFGGLIQDMQDTLIEQDGVGLAAVQINVAKRIFIIPPEYAPSVRTRSLPLSLLRPLRPTIFVNPIIISLSKELVLLDEGCLSVRNKFYPTPRAKKVTLQAQNERGKHFTVEAEDLLARIFQHETDHLDGTLFIDRIHENLSK